MISVYPKQFFKAQMNFKIILDLILHPCESSLKKSQASRSPMVAYRDCVGGKENGRGAVRRTCLVRQESTRSLLLGETYGIYLSVG